MATIMRVATDGGWSMQPMGGPAGTGISPQRSSGDDAAGVRELVGTRTGAGARTTRDVLAGLALGTGGVASILAGRGVGARLGAAGIGRGLGIALGVGALAGAALLLQRAHANATTEYVVNFASEPDLDGVAPGDVYWALRAHHEQHAPAVERELAALLSEEKVRSYSGVIGSNGFVVEAVNRHRDEVEQRLAALDEVGGVHVGDLQ